MFQNYALFDELSPSENVEIALDHSVNTSGSRADVRDRASSLLDQLGVPTDRSTSVLSGGQQQRLAIATVLGLKVRTIFEHFHLSFHVPVGSISEMNQLMHEQGNGGSGPATADSRYVTEDVPYGLGLTVMLGELAGQPSKLHQAGVRIFSAMYGRDFMAENELLNALDLSRFTLDDLKRAARTGLLKPEAKPRAS